MLGYISYIKSDGKERDDDDDVTCLSVQMRVSCFCKKKNR